MRPSLFLLCAALAAGASPGPAGAEPAGQPSAAADRLLGDLRGQPVVDTAGQPLGEVAGLVTDPGTGEATHLVVGLGEVGRAVAVPVDEVQLLPGGTQVRLRSWTRAQVEALREHAAGDLAGPSGGT